MFNRVKQLYISDYSKKSFMWRWCYEMVNNLVKTEVDCKFIPNCNPLRWCLMDLVNLAYLFIVGALMFVVLPIGSAFDAKSNKRRFESERCDWFLRDVIIPW